MNKKNYLIPLIEIIYISKDEIIATSSYIDPSTQGGKDWGDIDLDL